MTPALMVILCVPAPVAVGTGLAAILVNSNIGMLKRRGSGTVDVKLAITIGIGSIAGVIVGSQILELLKYAPGLVILGKEHNMIQYVLLCTYLVLSGSIAGYLYYDHKQNHGRSPQKRIGLFSKLKFRPYMQFSSLEEQHLSILPLLILGFCIGLLTGLIGIGGGVALLPGLIYLVGQRTAKAAGTSLVLVWISSLVAVIRKGAAGDINILLFIALLAGGIVGTILGTKIGLKLTGPKTRLYFVYVMIGSIAMIGFKLYKLTF